MTATVEYIDPTPGTLNIPLRPVTYTTTTTDRIEARSTLNRYFLDLDQAAKDARAQPVARKVRPVRQARETKPQKPNIRPCADCGTDTRPRTRTWAEKRPELPPRLTRDLCRPCARKTESHIVRTTRANPEAQIPDSDYAPTVKPCAGCGIDTRPDSTIAAVARPDLPARRTRGMCADCYNTGRRTTNRATLPKLRECPGCGKPTRPRRASITDHPGTKARHSGELCMACYQAARRAGK